MCCSLMRDIFSKPKPFSLEAQPEEPEVGETRSVLCRTTTEAIISAA